MRKAYRRRLREEFGHCLSGADSTAAAAAAAAVSDLGSPAGRPRQAVDEDTASSPAAIATSANKTVGGGSVVTTTSTSGIGRTHKSSAPIWLLRRQRSH